MCVVKKSKLYWAPWRWCR